MAHHFATIGLILYSWQVNFSRVGAMTFLCHDFNDVFLEGAKLARYARSEAWSTGLFAAFAGSWFVSRLFYFPLWIIWTAYYDPAGRIALPYGMKERGGRREQNEQGCAPAPRALVSQPALLSSDAAPRSPAPLLPLRDHRTHALSRSLSLVFRHRPRPPPRLFYHAALLFAPSSHLLVVADPQSIEEGAVGEGGGRAGGG